MKHRLISSAVLATLIAPAAAQLEATMGKLSELAGYETNARNFEVKPDGSIVLEGNVHIKSDDIDVYADKTEYIPDTSQMKFTGNVAIYRDLNIYRGDSAVFNTETQQLDTSNMRTSVEPMFLKAATVTSQQGEVSVINATDAEFTTDDSQTPGYHLASQKVTVYPEERIVFEGVKIYAGETPVFYLPYLSQPLEDELGYTFTPGYRSNLGAFLLNQYGSTLGDHSIIKYKFDAYSSRGLGLGFDIESRAHKADQFGKFKFYWVHDTDPQANSTFSSKQRVGVDSSRYRINLQHRINLTDEGDLYLDVDVNKLSDDYFYEDFFPWEFRDDPQPDNLVNLVKHHDRGELSVLARFRANDFYQTDSRLPEIALDLARQPVFDTGAFYASTTSFGMLKEEIGEYDELQLREQLKNLDTKLADPILAAELDPAEARTSLDDLKARLEETEFTRFYSYHELLYPITLDGGFTITPKVEAGIRNYSSVSGTTDPVNSSSAIFAAGVDTAFKFSRTWDDVSIPELGLDGLRHVVQPYLNLSYVTADELGTGFKGIDRLALSTRPRPLDVNNYTAIDSLRDWTVARIGVMNRLQTRRNNGTINWLSSNTYVDAFIDDPEFDRDFSNLYQDIEWSPVPWTRLIVGAQLPVFGGDQDFSEINTRVAFMPTDYLEFEVGHRLLSDHPFFQDSNLVDLRMYARINEDWGFSIWERYEVDDSTLEVQQYSVHKDLRSWVASLGAVIRDNRGEQEYGFLFSLTLKDFPSVRVPVDFDPQGGSGRR